MKVEVDNFPGRDSYVRIWPDEQELSEWLAITVSIDGTVRMSARSADPTSRLDVVRVNYQTVLVGIAPSRKP